MNAGAAHPLRMPPVNGTTRQGNPCALAAPAAPLADGEPRARGTLRIPLDAHGHFYNCFGADRFLSHAARNFTLAAGASALGDCAPGHLVIAATARADGLAALREQARVGDAGCWRLTPTADGVSMLALRGAAPKLVLLAGRQIVTTERLEVLAVACAVPIADGLSLRDTVDAARAGGAIVVLPWGFGKWSMGRGRAVRELLESEAALGIFVGDSAQRPWPGRAHSVLRLAEARGIRLLPGTDPLPLVSSTEVAGRFGCTIEGCFDPDRPAEALRRILADPATRPRPFGERASLLRFIRAQWALRAHRHSAMGGAL